MWPSLTFQFATIVAEMITLADPVFAKRFGLRIHQLRVLRLIAQTPGMTLTRLAAQTKLDGAETMLIVSQLIKDGYLVDSIDQGDATHFQLATTDKAKDVMRVADPLSLEMEGIVLSVLSPAQCKELETMLAALRDWIRSGLPDELAKRYPEFKPRAPADAQE